MRAVVGIRAMLALFGAALLLTLAGCGGEAGAPTVSITAADYSFAAADSIAGGLTRLSLTNNGPESHHAQLVRLNEGVTLPQFQAALQQGEANAFPLLTFQGGPAAVPPKASSVALVNLPPGQYMLLCFVRSPDGVPHLAKGMVRPLTVTAPPARTPSPPDADATVTLLDFAFTAPATLDKGKVSLEVVNNGQEPHEMSVLRLKGISVAQLQQLLTAPPTAPPPSGPPPFENAGGMQAIMPGQRGWVTLDLTPPGEYALVCFVPSPANQGAPHVALGMFAAVTSK